MKILHLEASPGWGGQEIRILREAEGMRGRGHEVILAVMRGGLLVEKARAQGFVVYEIDFQKKYWPIALFRLLKIIRLHRIEVVNTHSSLDAWIGGIVARIAKCKIVRTRHLSTPIQPGLNSRLLYGALADFVVTTCASILPMIVNQSGKSPTKCRSIPTGVDSTRIAVSPEERDLFRSKLGIQPTDFLIGTACFMRSWKGIGDFLQAAHLLRDQSHFKWVLIGGGHIDTYRAKAQEMKLEENVFFTGHLENPFAAIGALDAFALLSTAHEGVSQAILQAAYLEKPLIATVTGGLGEVCLDQITGIQVPPFSPLSVAAAVQKLYANPPFRRQLAKAAKQHVEKHFTLEQTLEAMQSVFAEVLQRKSATE